MNLLQSNPADLPGGKSQEHRADEARGAFFEDYSSLNKGVVTGSGDMSSQCGIEFLQAMWQNIRRLRRCIMLDMQDDQKNFPDLGLAIVTVLYETCAELRRLIEHPELLPQSTSRFFELMEVEFEILLGSVQLKQKEGRGLQEAIKQHRKRILADYDDGRTTWQQFLHGQAPGSGFPKGQMLQHGCTQMATAACQLLVIYKREEYEGHEEDDCPNARILWQEKRHTKVMFGGQPGEHIFQPRGGQRQKNLLGWEDVRAFRVWRTSTVRIQAITSGKPLTRNVAQLARRWTRVRVRPQTYRVNLINELAITEMRRLIKLADSRDRT
ncbi:MAG: hypothetical protein Q9213_006877 [Squamulea squamosa]